MLRSEVIPMTVYYAVCADCNAPSPPGLTEDDAETFARRAGWINLDGLHYCDEHARAAKGKYDFYNTLHEWLQHAEEVGEKHKDDPPTENE